MSRTITIPPIVPATIAPTSPALSLPLFEPVAPAASTTAASAVAEGEGDDGIKVVCDCVAVAVLVRRLNVTVALPDAVAGAVGGTDEEAAADREGADIMADADGGADEMADTVGR